MVPGWVCAVGMIGLEREAVAFQASSCQQKASSQPLVRGVVGLCGQMLLPRASWLTADAPISSALCLLQARGMEEAVQKHLGGEWPVVTWEEDFHILSPHTLL